MKSQKSQQKSQNALLIPTDEPYVIYEGFKLGFGVSAEANDELEHALQNAPQVVLLVEDSHFSAMLFKFIQMGQAGLESFISSRHSKKKSSFCLSSGSGAEALMKSFFEERKPSQRPCVEIFQRAQMQLMLLDSARTQLATSLPQSFSHPALNFIKKELEQTVQEDIAPRLVDLQLKTWGIDSSSVYAFSKRALENKVDKQGLDF